MRTKDLTLKVRKILYEEALKLLGESKKFELSSIEVSKKHHKRHPKPDVETQYDDLWMRSSEFSAKSSFFRSKANKFLSASDRLKRCDGLQAKTIIGIIDLEFPELGLSFLK